MRCRTSNFYASVEKILNIVNPKLRVASMFSGCGGLDYAFHKMVDNFEVIYQ